MPSRQSALYRTSHLKVLRTAWEHIRPRPTHPAWSRSHPDGAQLLQIASRTEEKLKEIANRIRTGYPFEPLRIFPLEKENGKLRIICIPSIADRIAQRAALSVLTDSDSCGLNNPVAYGFAKGPANKSHVDAAQKALEYRSQYEWAIKTDITQFFDAIDRDTLSLFIKKRVPFTTLHDFLINASRAEISHQNTFRAKLAKDNNIEHGRGVRQGMPLSPFFAALYLKEFDKWLTGPHIPAIRYADDLILFASTEKDASRLFSEVQERLGRLGLECPDPSKGTKTEFAPPRDPVHFLGAGIIWNDGQYTLQIPSKTIKRIARRFLNLGDLHHALEEEVTLFNLGTRLAEWRNSYSASYEHCNNCGSLIQTIDYCSSKAKEKMLRNIGIDLNTLTAAQKAVLRIE